MRFEGYIASRYVRGKRKNRFVNIITVISIAGVAVGVMTLIVVMSVMTGFDLALRDSIIGNRSHLTVTNVLSHQIYDWENLSTDLEDKCPEIVASGPVVQIESLLMNGRDQSPAMILGVDVERETRITQLAENLTTEGGRQYGAGELPGDKEIVLGYKLGLQRLGATVGSRIKALTFRKSTGAMGTQPMGQLYMRVSGISQAKMYEFDMVYGFVNLTTARMLSGDKGVQGIHMRLQDPFQAAAVKEVIEAEYPDLRAETWYENQEAFFGALEQEKFLMFIVLSFVVLVAAFNITSTLIMVVMEKRRDIGILRTLGVSTSSILRIFIYEGLFIGLGGTFLGVVCGTLFSMYLNPIAEFLASLFGVDLFNSQIYYFDRIPVSIQEFDIAVITVCSILLTFLSTLYPAWSASRLNPVDALRYE